MAPGLITGKIKANGYMDHNKNINNNWDETDRTLLHSKDFSKIDSRYDITQNVINKNFWSQAFKSKISPKFDIFQPSILVHIWNFEAKLL